MTAETAWAHLPNAKHIDDILYDVKVRPRAWWRAWGDIPYSVWAASRRAVDTVCEEAHMPAMRGVKVALSSSEFSLEAAMNTILALIAWDSSADLLECTPDVLRTMIDLAEPPVCHQAVLLLPYAIVRFGQ
jgi:hypothetical protein